MTPEDVSAEPEKTRDHINSGDRHVPLRWHLKKNGERFAVEITANQIIYRGRRTSLVALRDITARQQADMALRETEDRYRALFDRSLDCVFLMDFAGKFLDANPAALNLLGYAHEEITAITFQTLLTEDQLTRAFQSVKEVLSTGFQKQRLEFRLRCKDGREVFVETRSSLICREGKPFAIQGIARDISERKQVEAELNRERDLWRTLLDNSPDKIYFKDAQSRFVKCSQAMVVQFGVKSPDEMVGKSDFNFFTDAHAHPAFEDEQGIIRTGRPMIDREEREVWNDGRVTWVSSTKVPWLDSAGKIIGIMGISRDITDRKLAEAQVRLQSSALTAAANAIVITDRTGKIEWVNPAFTKLTGYSADESVGNFPRILKSGQHPPEFYHDLWETINAGKVWHGELVNRRKDGKLYHEDMIITPVRDAGGEIMHFVAVKQDITERQLLEDQLRQSQKMQAIGQLAGGVAHDFNNILAVIQMQAGILKADLNLPLEQMEIAGEIEKATERAANLTRQLLLFSRKQTLQLRDLDMNEAVSSITKMLLRVIGEDIQIQFKFDPQIMLVRADAGMLDQVLMNLAVNARDAMPVGGRLIIETSAVEFDEVGAAQIAQARPGSFVCVSVTDTGCGIMPEIIPRIFEPFFTTKEVGKGTGLGLATVFGILQQHQGWVYVYSEVGQGTTFRIYLPRLVQPTEKKDIVSSLAAMRGGNETILLVEDDAALCASVRIALTRLGYRVLEAANGRAALNIWDENRAEIRLLLTDLVMPEGMNGKELARQLLQENPALKVIYASGYSVDVADVELVLEDGVNFLAKPFEARKLAQTVRNCLDKI
jgi:PAS domain S-box-containing protein